MSMHIVAISGHTHHDFHDRAAAARGHAQQATATTAGDTEAFKCDRDIRCGVQRVRHAVPAANSATARTQAVPCTRRPGWRVRLH